jgi:hypothetical protein
VPHVVAPLSLQVLVGSVPPAGTLAQAPRWPGTLHDWQEKPQALSQQTLSAPHTPFEHSLVPPHAVPGAFFEAHLPVETLQ